VLGKDLEAMVVIDLGNLTFTLNFLATTRDRSVCFSSGCLSEVGAEHGWCWLVLGHNMWVLTS